MNILFFIGTYPGIGGTERITSVLARNFQRDGHRVFIASFRRTEASLPEENSGIDLIQLDSKIWAKKKRKAIAQSDS